LWTFDGCDILILRRLSSERVSESEKNKKRVRNCLYWPFPFAGKKAAQILLQLNFSIPQEGCSGLFSFILPLKSVPRVTLKLHLLMMKDLLFSPFSFFCKIRISMTEVVGNTGTPQNASQQQE
jgi:hypothetical protein